MRDRLHPGHVYGVGILGFGEQRGQTQLQRQPADPSDAADYNITHRRGIRSHDY